MRTLTWKLRAIYLPFMGIAAAFVAVYSFLNWLLSAWTESIHLNEELTNFWLPLALPWIPVLIWLRPRVKTLNLGKENLAYLYLFAGFGAIAAPTLMAQRYLSTAVGALSRLSSISEINSTPVTKYYALVKPCLDKDHARVERTSRGGGGRGDLMTFQIFVVVPFCSEPPGQLSPPVWLGIKYSRSMKKNLPDSEKEATWRAFGEASRKDFESKDVGAFTYLESLAYNDDRRGFEAAIRKSGQLTRPSWILLPHDGAYEQRNGDRLPWVFKSFAIGAAAFFLLVLFPSVNATEKRRLLHGAPSKHRDTWRVFLSPSRESYGILILVSINILVFLVMVFAGLGVASFRGDDLLSWGGNYGPRLEGLGVLRLVTSLFVHGGLMHLLNNLYGLIIAAMLLEPLIGGWKLLLLYLATGVVGGVASVVVHPATLSVGASGAIFGLFGMLIGLLLTRDERLASIRRFLLTNMLVYVGLNLLIGAIAPIVDNAAHVGGLVSGTIVGFAVGLTRRSHKAAAGPRDDGA